MYFCLLGQVHAHQDDTISGIEPARLPQTYVQSWLGYVDTDNAWSLDDPEDQAPLTGDISRLPMAGGVGQRLWGNRLQYGFEGGGLVGWKSDDVSFYGRTGYVRIKVDNSLFFAEPFFGGVIALRPTNWLRLYAAAGPSIAWGYLAEEDDNADSADGYSVGSRWVDTTNGNRYTCLDNTITAAVWRVGGFNNNNLQFVTATASTTTTSIVHVALDSMTITPGGGTYWVTFSATGSNNKNSQQTIAVIRHNGVQITETERELSGQANNFGNLSGANFGDPG